VAATPLEVVRALYPQGRVDLAAPGVLDGWIAALTEVAHPDFIGGDPRAELLPITSDPEDFARVWREWLSAWETWRVDILGYEEGAPGRVLVDMQIEARSKKDSVPMPRRGANVVHVEDERIKRIELYFDREAARLSAGLGAEPRSG